MYNYNPSYDLRTSNQYGFQPVNSNNFTNANPEIYPDAQDDRFFLAPFVVGGLAGTALGYGIANNNQLNNQGQCCYNRPPMYYPQPIYPYPYMYSSNNYYY